MVLVRIVAELTLVVGGMILVASAAVTGRRQAVAGLRRWRHRLSETWPHFAVLGVALVLNRVVRHYGPQVSFLFDINITGLVYRVEGSTVAVIQSLATPELTAVFGFVYIYGYAFLLVFPIVAYFLLADADPLRRLLTAYVVNYTVGVAVYTLVIAYGPRNLLPDLVDPLLFETFPFSKLLTARVNNPTNVFPSLHTSLSTTVAVLAWETRDVYPRWPVLAVPFAVGVGLATMYLGIHWVTDVLAGICLGVGSVVVAGRLVC